MTRPSKYLLLILPVLVSCNSYFFIKNFNAKRFDSSPRPVEKEGWSLTFSDEFNEGNLDLTKWSTATYYGGHYHPEILHNYYGEDAFEFTGSSVKLLAKREPKEFEGILIPYAVGLLDNSKSMDQQYGYYEIRCRLPLGKATWPAFWLVSRHAWPPEVDIFEFYGSNDINVMATNYHWGTSDNKKMSIKKFRIKDTTGEYHVYGCEWSKDFLKWYIDGVLVRTAKKGISEFKYPMHITVNNALENNEDLKNGKATLPNYFEVDYVRAYRLKE